MKNPNINRLSSFVTLGLAFGIALDAGLGAGLGVAPNNIAIGVAMASPLVPLSGDGPTTQGQTVMVL